MKLILASQSEWRDRLLGWLGEPYEVRVSGVDESEYSNMDPEEMVAMLANAKARKVADELKSGVVDEVEGRLLVIGADTVVVVDGEIIGKPVDKDDARRIIQKLQGRGHAVLTGLCVMDVDTDEGKVDVDATEVYFKAMNASQIETYLDTGEWEGKAGGYQIVRAIDSYIEKVDGSVTNVIGLPMGLLTEMLEEFGMSVGTNVEQVLRAETGYDSKKE